MVVVALLLAVFLLVVVAGLAVCAAGVRAGDRPGDAAVDATLRAVHQADGAQRVAVAVVRNPSPFPALVGLSVRPYGLSVRLNAGFRVSVPRRTARARWLAGRQAVLGVVGAGETGTWTVPVPSGCGRLQLEALVGQADRLRRTQLVVAPAPVVGQVGHPAPSPCGQG